MTPDDVSTRTAAEARLEEGWAGTFLLDPLTALAGGLLGGATVTVVLWRIVWRHPSRRK